MKITRRMRNNVLILVLLVLTIVLASCDKPAEIEACENWGDVDCIVKATPYKTAIPQDTVLEGTTFKVWFTAKIGGELCDPTWYDKYEGRYIQIAEAPWRIGFSSTLDWTPIDSTYTECTPGQGCEVVASMSQMAALDGEGALTFDDFCVNGVDIELAVTAPQVTSDTSDELTFFYDVGEMQEGLMTEINTVFEEECTAYIKDEYSGLASGNNINNCNYNAGQKGPKPYEKCYIEHYCKNKCTGYNSNTCPDDKSVKWAGPTYFEINEEGMDPFTVTVQNLAVQSDLPEGVAGEEGVNTANGRRFTVPLNIQADGVETDLSRLHFAVVYPTDKVLLESVSLMEQGLGEEEEGFDLILDETTQGIYCTDFPGICDFEVDPEVPFTKEFYEIDMARLLADGAPSDHVEVTLDTYVDLFFSVNDFFTGELPILVVPGVSSTVEGAGTTWLSDSVVDITSQASEYDARCAQSDLDNQEFELFVGQNLDYVFTMQKPDGTQSWGDDFQLRVVNAGELVGWDLTEWVQVSELAEENIQPNGVGDQLDYSFTMPTTAPTQPGLFSISYQMFDSENNPFGELCQIPVFVTDRVVPGWSVAYPDNGFAGYDVGGVDLVDGAIFVEKTDDGKGGIVSDVITIPEAGTGMYEASVLLSEACGSDGSGASIQVINAFNSNPIPGDSGFDVDTSRATFTPNAELQEGEQYRLHVFSNYNPPEDFDEENCVMLSDVAFINTDEIEELDPELHFSPTTSPAGCCPEGYCWLNDECVSVESTDDVTKPLACDAQGVWTIKTAKKDFYGESEGYCLDESMCYYHGDGGNEQRCVTNGEYFGDQYCADGNWTTRTAVVAAQLLDVATGAQDYALYCGKPGDALNFMNYKASVNAGAMVKDVLGCQSVDAGDSTCNNINNVCVLEFVEGGQLKTMFGLSLNTPIGATEGAGGILPALGEDKGACDLGGAINNDNDYDECATTGVDVYFDGSTNTTIVQPKSLAYNDLVSINTLTDVTKESGAFDVFLGVDTPGDRLRHLAINYEDDENSEEFYNFIENFRHFNNFYVADWNSKQVFGIQEVYSNVQPFGEDEEMLTRTGFTGVFYDGFGSEFCPALAKIPETYTDGVLPPQVCEHPDFGCCFNSERTVHLQNDQFATYGDAIDPTQMSQGIFRFFPDLTVKLRVS